MWTVDDTNSLSQWEKLDLIGEGGNGEVWRARRNGVECALKILKTTNVRAESYRRFMSEIQVLRDLSNDPSVLQILDAYLPDSPSEENKAWFSMPLATGIKKALGPRPRIENVVEAIASIAETLTRLAEKQISHRDIKPENLYFFKDSWVIGDFGLADFPNKDDVTEKGRALGPRFYIAPEMVREPTTASGFPADVWSLAKTMWVLATGQNYPPPHPQFASDPKDALDVLINHRRAFYLDNLIEQATSKEPSQRPTMLAFATALRKWLALGTEPIPEPDISDLTSEIRRLSSSFFDTQSRMQRCREQAELMTTQLMEDLKGLSEKLRETGLPHNEPKRNGGTLHIGSGLPPSDQGKTGVTVLVSTPSPTTHIYECGILIQVVDERRHRLYAAHRIIPHRIRPHNRQVEIIWSESHETDSGSSQEQQLLNQLVKGLYDNVRLGLERFRQILALVPTRADS
jgi:serine/threonine protein kinase